MLTCLLDTVTAPATQGIRIAGATLRRGESVVLRDLDLRLDEKRIGLIGDNGAGKSSLFRMISGLDVPQQGTVTIPGPVGIMFQNPDEQIIFPTVEEDLALGLTSKGMPRQEARRRVREFLSERGLDHWAQRAVGGLSQGQRQHVCWLALAVTAPKVLLLDEPFASLDLPGQARLRKEIEDASQQIIVSTHVMQHVRAFERVIWLDHGRVRADGCGREVCAAYEADVAGRAGIH